MARDKNIMPLFFAVFAALLVVPIVYPRLDLIVSDWFYRADTGFIGAGNVLCEFLHRLAYDGARVMGIAFAVVIAAGFIKRHWGRHSGHNDHCVPNADPPSKSALFLLLALLVGPGLVANVGLKDHWGRARPREIVEFGGASPFTPALEPHFDKARSNGSFVSGDAAFGFFLPFFAYIAPPKFSRRIFFGGMIAGCLFGFVRIIMGAHFFSDVVYAAAAMTACGAGVHAVMYGRKETLARWRLWLGKA